MGLAEGVQVGCLFGRREDILRDFGLMVHAPPADEGVLDKTTRFPC